MILILAGVSIVTLTGDNGLLTQVQNTNTTSKIAEIEEQANLQYTAMLIDQLSGKTSKNVALEAVCIELRDTYNLPVQLITTDAPTVDKVIFTSDNVTKSNEGTVGTISIAQGTEETTIVAEAVVTPATGNWYAVVEGKHYKMNIPSGQNRIEIERTETDVSGANNTPAVIYSSNNDKVTVNENTGMISVTDDATGPAEITATAGGKSAICTVTVLKYITVTVASENTSKGTVTALAENSYLEGSKITLTATPADGYKLDGWYIGSSKQTLDNENKYTVPTGGTATSIELVAKFLESSSEIAKGINSGTYGKYVNYNINLGIGDTSKVTDDWKVFYDDGTNIYIIAADYVPVSNTYLATAMTNTGAVSYKNSYPYCVKWSSGTSFKTYKNGTTSTAANGAADIFTNRPAGTAYLEGRGFLGFWKEQTTTSDYANAKMTASLMDTKAWEGFAGGLPTGVTGTAYAIGGPTVSMWMESWNVTYPSDKLYYNRASSAGYCVKAGGQPSTSDYSISDTTMKAKTGYNNTLYYPHQSALSNCTGYWLASPSANGTMSELYVWCNGYITEEYSFRDDRGVRPVVCLPSNVQLEIDSENNNLYNITNGTSANS